MGLAWYAELLAGGVLGLGLLWWLVQALNQGKVDAIEKASAENFAKGELEARQTEKTVDAAARTAQENVDSAESADW